MGKSRTSSTSSSSSSSSSSSDEGKKDKRRSKDAKEADVLQVKAERSSISPVRTEKTTTKERSKSPEKEPVRKTNKKDDVLTNRTGGAYIPPARLRAMQESITDKNSTAYQRISWEALKKSIHGIVNKVNYKLN